MTHVAAPEFSGEPSLPDFGEVLRRQIRLSLWWLVSGLLAVFLANALLDVSIIFVGPAIAVVILIWWLAICIRCFAAGWRRRHEGRTANLVVLAPVAALAALALLVVPVGQLGSYTQAATTLLLNRGSYEKLMAETNVSTTELHKKWAESGGTGGSAIWSFGYGGFLTMDRDIVYDPLGRPEERAMKLLGAQAASCRSLWAHYYDCFLDY